MQAPAAPTRRKSNRQWGILLLVVGSLFTLPGILAGIVTLFLFSSIFWNGDPSWGVVSVLVCVPMLAIGMPLLVAGLWLVLAGKKAETVYATPEKRGGTNSWGAALLILGVLALLGGTLALATAVLVFPFGNRMVGILDGSFVLIPGLVVGIPLLLLGIWLINRYRAGRTASPPQGGPREQE